MGIEHTCAYSSPTHTQFRNKLCLEKEEGKGKENVAWWYIILVLLKSALFCEVLSPETKETEKEPCGYQAWGSISTSWASLGCLGDHPSEGVHSRRQSTGSAGSVGPARPNRPGRQFAALSFSQPPVLVWHIPRAPATRVPQAAPELYFSGL